MSTPVVLAADPPGPPPLDPAFDKWVWLGALVFLVVLGARAWVVETSRARPGRAPVRVRTLTGLTVAVLAGLAVLLWIQGGSRLTHSLLTGTDPATGLPIGVDPAAVAPAEPGPADQAPARGGEAPTPNG